MIKINNKDITEIYFNNKKISVVYKSGKIIWQAIRSCFGSGFWVDEKPWLNNEGWKNNKNKYYVKESL